MKKFSTILGGLALVLVGSVALSACGTTTDTVRLASGDVYVSEAEGAAAFTNDSSLAMSYDEETATYTVTGTASYMTDAQATDFYNGVAAAGDAYIIIEVELDEYTTAVLTSTTGSATMTVDDNVCVIALTGKASSKDSTRTLTITTVSGATTTTTVYTLDTSAVETGTYTAPSTEADA